MGLASGSFANTSPTQLPLTVDTPPYPENHKFYDPELKLQTPKVLLQHIDFAAWGLSKPSHLQVTSSIGLIT